MEATTHLGQFLSALIRDEQIDAKTLAARMKIHETVLSRLITGKRRTCNEATKEKIVRGCSPDQLRRAHCLAAYLKDQRLPELAPCVSISVHA